MIISIQREEFFRPLQKISAIIEKAHAIKILSNVLVEARDQYLTLVGSDSNIQIVTHSSATVLSEGEFTVSAKKVLEICKLLPEKCSMQLTVENGKLEIDSQDSHFTLKTLASKDFPKLEKAEVDCEVFVKAENFKQSIEKTAFCMGIEDVRKFLNGLYFEIENDKMTVIGSDGHRLGLSVINLFKPITAKVEIIIPRKAVLELFRLLDDSNNTLKINVSKRFISVEIQNLEYTAKLMDCKFPNYKGIVSEQTNREIGIETRGFINALSRVSILSNEINRGVIFDIEPNKVTLNSHNSESEQASETIKVQYNGKRIIGGFNAGYVLEALKKISTDKAVLEIKDGKGLMVITEDYGEQSKFIVMPLQL